MEQHLEEELWKAFNEEVLKKPKIDISALKYNSVKYSAHGKFWDKFLAEKFPEGNINKTLEKNFAIWAFLNGCNFEQIQVKYKSQGWDSKPFMGWVKKVAAGDLYEYNPGEIYLWCKNNNRMDLIEFIKDDPMIKEIEKRSNEIKIMWGKDLRNYIEKQVSWLTEGIIKSGSINVLGGKRASLKSWFGLAMSIAIANGTPFLGKFNTSKGNVLYLDRENQFSELKNRYLMTTEVDTDIMFMSESYVKIDNLKDIAIIEDIIVRNEIKLLVIDVYRRVISFDENDAGEVSKLFVDILKPLTERTGVAIILIHHEKKGESSGDEMDMLRGSSDLANYVDGILQLERKGNSLIVKQTKNRSGKELEPFQVKVDTDEKTFFKLVYSGCLETTGTKIAKVITDWIINNNITEFTYSKVISYCESMSYKKSNIITALNELQNSGLIVKGNEYHSPYTVFMDFKGGID